MLAFALLISLALFIITHLLLISKPAFLRVPEQLQVAWLIVWGVGVAFVIHVPYPFITGSAAGGMAYLWGTLRSLGNISWDYLFTRITSTRRQR